MSEFASGFVAIVGRPNSGKSTLINSLMGKKAALSSNFPQTTRTEERYVLNLPSCQAVLVDTPGIGKPRTLLGERLNGGALRSIASADLALFLTPANEGLGKGDRRIIANLHSLLSKRREGKSEWQIPVVALVTKADEAGKEEIREKVREVEEAADFTRILAVSSFTHYHTEELEALFSSLLPPGPALYGPEDEKRSEEEECAQIVRSAFLPMLYDELPHSLVVRCERGGERSLIFKVYVEKESQKSIVIGKGGSVLTRVRKEAIPELRAFLGFSPSVRFEIKVAKDWQKDPKKLDYFGFY
ncbi:MAG: GTPase Era [Aeriscardovia sp.]|nr:GTPase Era [Aeriscardovia sp.]